jgi:DNA polymerase III beta subunit, N-terminal domain
MIESNTMVDTGTGMKVVCSKDELAQRLGVVARAVSTRASVQILAGVLLRAENERLHLAATDMELSLRSSMEAQVGGEGTANASPATNSRLRSSATTRFSGRRARTAPLGSTAYVWGV